MATEQKLLNRWLASFTNDAKAIVTEDKIQDEITNGNVFTIATVLTVPTGGLWVVFDSTDGVGVLEKLVLLPTALNADNGPLTITYYAGTTYTDGTGTEYTATNRNAFYSVSNPSCVTLLEAPTITANGTEFSSYLLPATSLGVKTSGASSSTIYQSEFPAGLTVAAFIENVTNPAVSVSLGFIGTWIEVHEDE